MKFSYAMLPDYSLEESLRAIQLADELGYHAVYAADETWHKDLWLLFAAAADKTSSIRMGPSVSAVVLREPSLIAQAAATLDELTGGRAEVVLSSGNFGLLAQYKMDWTKTKPLSRVIEAVHVVRTLLDDGAITYSREAYEYAAEHLRIGAERAGKDWTTLDFGAWVVVAVGRDSAAAKDAARSMVGIYASSMPAEQLERNGVDPDSLKPIIDAIGGGDLARGIELTTPEIAEKLSFAGTPAEVTAKIKEIEPAGVNHLIAAITDASMVKAFTGRELAGVATVEEQLRLLHDEVMPQFA